MQANMKKDWATDVWNLMIPPKMNRPSKQRTRLKRPRRPRKKSRIPKQTQKREGTKGSNSKGAKKKLSNLIHTRETTKAVIAELESKHPNHTPCLSQGKAPSPTLGRHVKERGRIKDRGLQSNDPNTHTKGRPDKGEGENARGGKGQ